MQQQPYLIGRIGELAFRGEVLQHYCLPMGTDCCKPDGGGGGGVQPIECETLGTLPEQAFITLSNSLTSDGPCNLQFQVGQTENYPTLTPTIATTFGSVSNLGLWGNGSYRINYGGEDQFGTPFYYLANSIEPLNGRYQRLPAGGEITMRSPTGWLNISDGASARISNGPFGGVFRSATSGELLVGVGPGSHSGGIATYEDSLLLEPLGCQWDVPCEIDVVGSYNGGFPQFISFYNSNRAGWVDQLIGLTFGAGINTERTPASGVHVHVPGGGPSVLDAYPYSVRYRMYRQMIVRVFNCPTGSVSQPTFTVELQNYVIKFETLNSLREDFPSDEYLICSNVPSTMIFGTQGITGSGELSGSGGDISGEFTDSNGRTAAFTT